MYEKIGSVALILIAIVLIVACSYYLGQRSPAESNQVKVALADMTVHANQLERQSVETRTFLAKFVEELKSLKNDDVDKILKKYGSQ